MGEDKKEQEVSKSNPIGEEIDANREKITEKKKETKINQTCSKKKATSKNVQIAAGLSFMERPWEDMVITPMPGIPPLDWPYRTRRGDTLPYAESPDDEEELMFHLEMDD